MKRLKESATREDSPRLHEGSAEIPSWKGRYACAETAHLHLTTSLHSLIKRTVPLYLKALQSTNRYNCYRMLITPHCAMAPPLAAMMRSRRAGIPLKTLHSVRFGVPVITGRTNAAQLFITALYLRVLRPREKPDASE